MKNKYYSFQNINETAASIKQFFIAITIVASVSLNNSFGQVNITAPSLTITTCAFPSAYIPLGDIVITEGLGLDISTFGDLILTAPANFEFQPSTATVTYIAGSNIGSASIITTSTTITLTITQGAGGSLLDAITISSIKLRAINSPSGPSNVTRTGGTSVIAGLVNGTTHATLTSVLNSVTGGTIAGAQTICSAGNPLAFTETVAATGSGTLIYDWKSSADGYSGTLSTNAIYDVPAGLTTTTTYRRYTKSTLNGVNCIANSNDLIVTVNDITGGYLSSPQTICNAGNPAPFTETNLSVGTGVVSYDWRYSTDTYSSTLAGSATFDVPAGLIDTTTYRRIAKSTLNGVSCTANSNDITITVISVIGGAVSSPQTLCSGSAPSQLTGTTSSGGDGSYTYFWEQSILSPTTGFTAATNTNVAAIYYPGTLSDTTWYRRKVASAGCSSNDTAAIKMTVNPIPLLTSVLADTACSGTPFNYNPTSQVIGASFAWSRAVATGISNPAASGTDSPNETLINTTVNPAFVYYLYTVSANGCTNTPTSVAVTVKTSPQLSSDTTLLPICSNTILGYVPTSSTTGASFIWTRAAVAGISNPAASGNDSLSETLINTTTAPVNVTYVYTTASNGCSSNQNIVVTVNPTPLLSNNLAAIICSDVFFYYTPTSATTGTTFSWTRAIVAGISNAAGSGTDSTAEQLHNTTTTSILVNYIYTLTADGCSNNETIAVTVNPAPLITNVTEDTICSGTDPNITLTADMPSTFAWTLGENPGGITGGSDSSGYTLNQILTNPSNSTTFSLQYQIIATSISGTCSGNSSAIFINVNPLPLASAGSNSTICSDSSVIIGGSPTASAGTGPYTYAWSPSVGLNSPTFSNPTANPAINTTYSVTVTDSLGCAASVSTMLVTVNPAPNVSAGSDVSICIGNNITLHASGGTTYLWSNGSSADSITVNPTVSTSYNVMGTANGCSHSDTVLVTVSSIPTVSAGNDTTICSGQTATLSASGGTSYLWSTGSIANAISDNPPATTNYFVTGTTNGCSMNDTVQVTVNALPIVNSGSDVSICAGQTTTLTAVGNAPPYTWNNGVTDGTGFTPTTTAMYSVTATMNGCSQFDTVLVTVNPIPTVNAGVNDTVCEGDSKILAGTGDATSYNWDNGVTNAIAFYPAATATYVVTGILNGCTLNDTVEVTVNPAPVANIATGTPICHGDTATLTGTGGVSFSWSNGVTNSTITVNPDTSTSYTLTVTDNLGCTASDTAVVAVTPSKNIYGNARYSLGPVTSGVAVLYKYEQFQTRFDSIQYVPLNPSTGDYFFTNINYGQYLVKVFADSTSYPTLINTYYGDEFLWDGDSVRVINHSCNLNTTLDSVTMVELTGTGGGIGLIIGQIIEGISFGRVEGEPIPGVDIELGKNPGGIIATTQTNGTGHYTFSGVADGNYTIYVDIPGLGRDSSYTFDVDSTNNQFLNQNYIADSNSVFMNPTSTVGISNPANATENKFSVYPNPVKGNTTIEYTIFEMTDSKIKLEIYTILGVKISTLVNTSQQAGIYKYIFNPQNNNLNSGIYLISLCIDGQTSTKRIIVME